jgi:tetratricopeptide (TPR) repeat protein
MQSVLLLLLLSIGQTAPPQAPKKESDELRRGTKLVEEKKYDEAIAVYEAALAKEPKNPDLLFDLGLAARAKGDLDRARGAFEKELALKPDDAEGHLVVAEIHEAQGHRIPAVLAYLRFLSLSPDSDRARGVYDSAERLMSAGLERDRHDPDQLVLAPKKGSTAKGAEAADAETLMAFIAAAAKYSEPDAKPPSEAEKIVKQLQVFTGFLAQTSAVEDPFAAKQYVPFFAEMNSSGFVEPFGYLVAASTGKGGAKEWVDANGARVTKVKGWARAWRPAR